MINCVQMCSSISSSSSSSASSSSFVSRKLTSESYGCFDATGISYSSFLRRVLCCPVGPAIFGGSTVSRWKSSSLWVMKSEKGGGRGGEAEAVAVSPNFTELFKLPNMNVPLVFCRDYRIFNSSPPSFSSPPLDDWKDSSWNSTTRTTKIKWHDFLRYWKRRRKYEQQKEVNDVNEEDGDEVEGNAKEEGRRREVERNMMKADGGDSCNRKIEDTSSSRNRVIGEGDSGGTKDSDRFNFTQSKEKEVGRKRWTDENIEMEDGKVKETTTTTVTEDDDIASWVSEVETHGMMPYVKDWHFFQMGVVAGLESCEFYDIPKWFVDDWFNLQNRQKKMKRKKMKTKLKKLSGCNKIELSEYDGTSDEENMDGNVTEVIDEEKEENEVEKEDEEKDFDFRFVYAGPKGSWTDYHMDVLGSFSWSANLCGRKRWRFYVPKIKGWKCCRFDDNEEKEEENDEEEEENEEDDDDDACKQKFKYICINDRKKKKKHRMCKCRGILRKFKGKKRCERRSEVEGGKGKNKCEGRSDERRGEVDRRGEVEGKGEWFEFLQHAGEIVFVPSGWYHEVWNEDDCLSINHNWVNGANILEVANVLKEDLKSLHSLLADDFKVTIFDLRRMNRNFGLRYCRNNSAYSLQRREKEKEGSATRKCEGRCNDGKYYDDVDSHAVDKRCGEYLMSCQKILRANGGLDFHEFYWFLLSRSSFLLTRVEEKQKKRKKETKKEKDGQKGRREVEEEVENKLTCFSFLLLSLFRVALLLKELQSFGFGCPNRWKGDEEETEKEIDEKNRYQFTYVEKYSFSMLRICEVLKSGGLFSTYLSDDAKRRRLAVILNEIRNYLIKRPSCASKMIKKRSEENRNVNLDYVGYTRSRGNGGRSSKSHRRRSSKMGSSSSGRKKKGGSSCIRTKNNSTISDMRSSGDKVFKTSIDKPTSSSCNSTCNSGVDSPSSGNYSSKSSGNSSSDDSSSSCCNITSNISGISNSSGTSNNSSGDSSSGTSDNSSGDSSSGTSDSSSNSSGSIISSSGVDVFPFFGPPPFSLFCSSHGWRKSLKSLAEFRLFFGGDEAMILGVVEEKWREVIEGGWNFECWHLFDLK